MTTEPFAQQIDLDPAMDRNILLQQAPRHSACFLLTDTHGQPVQLAHTADLQQALTRRLTPIRDTDRHADLSQIVAGVKYTPIHCRLAGDLLCLEHAYQLMPEMFTTMTKTWRHWWIQRRTHQPIDQLHVVNSAQLHASQTAFGPFQRQSHAQRICDQLLEIGQLCRCANSRGEPNTSCVYRQINRCLAPCTDPTQLEPYQQQMNQTVQLMQANFALCQSIQLQMQQAAEALKFEEAAYRKKLLDQARTICRQAEKNPLDLQRFRFITVQKMRKRPGQYQFGYALPGALELTGISASIDTASSTLNRIAEIFNAITPTPLNTADRLQIARLDLCCWYLLRQRPDTGYWHRLPTDCQIDPPLLQQILTHALTWWTQLSAEQLVR